VPGADDPQLAVASLLRGASKRATRRGRLQRRAAPLALLLLAACGSVVRGYRPLPPPTSTRLAYVRHPDSMTSGIRIAMEHAPNEFVRSYTELSFAVGDRTELAFEAPLIRWSEASGRSSSWTGDLVLRWRQDLLAAAAGPGELSPWPALSSELAYVDDHGGARAARVPGLVENESGWIARLAADWPFGGFSGREAALHANVGGALLGRPRDSGDSGRILFGAGLTQALAQPGIGWSTESLAIGIETFWVLDPVDDRRFGELSAALVLPVDAHSFSFGARFGLTDDTEDIVFFVEFASQLFDALL
jgi:hypothetical protein